MGSRSLRRFGAWAWCAPSPPQPSQPRQLKMEGGDHRPPPPAPAGQGRAGAAGLRAPRNREKALHRGAIEHAGPAHAAQKGVWGSGVRRPGLTCALAEGTEADGRHPWAPRLRATRKNSAEGFGRGGGGGGEKWLRNMPWTPPSEPGPWPGATLSPGRWMSGDACGFHSGVLLAWRGRDRRRRSGPHGARGGPQRTTGPQGHSGKGDPA